MWPVPYSQDLKEEVMKADQVDSWELGLSFTIPTWQLEKAGLTGSWRDTLDLILKEFLLTLMLMTWEEISNLKKGHQLIQISSSLIQLLLPIVFPGKFQLEKKKMKEYVQI